MGPDGKIEGDENCVICLEPVLASGRMFGILQNCSHAFCLDCIRNWRATYDKKVKKTHYRTCPICRTNSYLVIPSYHMIYDDEVKEQILEDY
jgi:E3 ubiquitin-protein ligase makorin